MDKGQNDKMKRRSFLKLIAASPFAGLLPKPKPDLYPRAYDCYPNPGFMKRWKEICKEKGFSNAMVSSTARQEFWEVLCRPILNPPPEIKWFEDAYNIGSSSYSCTDDIPVPSGKVTRRPGTKYICDARGGCYRLYNIENTIYTHNGSIVFYFDGEKFQNINKTNGEPI